MRKLLYKAASVLLLLTALFIPNQQAQAANVSLGVSKSLVNIGDSVTVTVTVPENANAQMDLLFPNNILSYTSASTETSVNGGTVALNAGKMIPGAGNKVTVTFKALTAGIAEIKLNVNYSYDDNGDDITLGGSSAKVTVQNETTSTEKNGDFYLSKLNITAGAKQVALSPAFKYSTKVYTATVDNGVTSVVVSCVTSNKKATIESITGNGNVNLKVGENKVEIVVKAENGKTLTYTVTITRKEQGTTPKPPTDSQTPPEEQGKPDFEYGGNSLFVNTEVPDDMIPADFTEERAVIGGNKEVTLFSFGKGELQLLFLKNTDGNSAFYVYEGSTNQVYPFIKLDGPKGYVIVLTPNDETAPEGYAACTFTIEGKGTVRAYQYSSQNEGASDFYLLYAMNNNGETNWYQYDSVEQTHQRYAGVVPSGAQDGTDEGDSEGEPEDTEVGNVNGTDLQSKYDSLESRFKDAKRLVLVMICVIIFLIAVFVVVIVNLLIRKRRELAEEDDEDEVEFIDL